MKSLRYGVALAILVMAVPAMAQTSTSGGNTQTGTNTNTNGAYNANSNYSGSGVYRSGNSQATGSIAGTQVNAPLTGNSSTTSRSSVGYVGAQSAARGGSAWGGSATLIYNDPPASSERA
jgi:hypothetical protein